MSYLVAEAAAAVAVAQQTAGGRGAMRKRKSVHRRDSKRGVTFKTGLIADKEVHEEYKGALVNIDEVREIGINSSPPALRFSDSSDNNHCAPMDGNQIFMCL